MNNYNAEVNRKYASRIAEVHNRETGLNISADDVEGWAVYLSALLERTDCKRTVDQVLCDCMMDGGVWQSLVNYFNRTDHERKNFD